MKLLIMGPPGVGKGTQAKILKTEFSIAHLSTGEILRKEIAGESEVGIIAKHHIDKGQLVPDKVLLNIIRDRITMSDCSNGYLLDGFPRTIEQAIGLEDIMISLDHALDMAISLTADEEELINRLKKRGVDSGRSDDTANIISKRQKIYWEQTAPLLDFYNNKGLLKNIDGIGTIDEITKRILKVLK